MRIIKIISVLTLAIVFCWQGLLFSHPQAIGETDTNSKKELEVSAVEDLMREHGALRRILLIYEELRSRLSKNKKVESYIIVEASRIVRNFIENYHEKLEEEYIFPKFKKNSALFDTAAVLKKQHEAGRRITNSIMQIANGKIEDKKKQKELMRYFTLFIRMYRPHSAREDTILFPGFKAITQDKEYDELGDKFEEREVKLFGEKGFEGIVGRVTALEKKLGIYDLSQFTPSNPGSD